MLILYQTEVKLTHRFLWNKKSLYWSKITNISKELSASKFSIRVVYESVTVSILKMEAIINSEPSEDIRPYTQQCIAGDAYRLRGGRDDIKYHKLKLSVK
jgi:hypothetical protein